MRLAPRQPAGQPRTLTRVWSARPQRGPYHAPGVRIVTATEGKVVAPMRTATCGIFPFSFSGEPETQVAVTASNGRERLAGIDSIRNPPGSVIRSQDMFSTGQWGSRCTAGFPPITSSHKACVTGVVPI